MSDRQHNYWTYIMASVSRVIYVGVTSDLEGRVWQHKSKAIVGFTKKYNCTKLVWFEEFPTREEAKVAEAQIKNWSRRKKEALIGGKIDELKQAARKDWASYRQRRASEC